MKIKILLIAAGCIIFSCKSTVHAPSASTQKLENHPWTVSLMNKQTNPTTPQGSRLILNFHVDHTVNGFDGCNEFTGKFTAENGKISFNNFLSTQKACPETQLPRQYMELLGNANRYSLKEHKLILYQNKKILLELEPQN